MAIDSLTTTSGAFTLNTSGLVAPGGSCEGALFQSGAFTCAGGLTCDGPVGARRCGSQCSDGVDNNGDGTIDSPNDPGCFAPVDNAEDTLCPGPTCPACADGVDNDADTFPDYPADTNCQAASGGSELCTSTEPIAAITDMVTMGTTVGAINDYDPTCNLATGLAPDLFYQLEVPAS